MTFKMNPHRLHVNTLIRTLRILPVLLLLAGAPAPGETVHTVKGGENLDIIGRTYGVTAAEIATFNGLGNPDMIQAGMKLKIPAKKESASAPAGPATYEVKAGDTLGGIAEKLGTTVTALSELNQIDDPRNLKAGAVLKVPAATAKAAEKSPPVVRHALPADLKRTLDAMTVTKGKWKKIVIHHSASKKGSLQGMDMYHRQKRRMENGLAYHFVIGNGHGMRDGKIEIGNRWKRQIKGGHVASDAMNQIAIGICLVGNFEVDRPTEAQMKSLYALVSYLCNRSGISKINVKTHRQINTKPTACPGKLFPTQTLLKNI